MAKKLREVDVGKPVRSWFLSQGWDVHCEVVYGGARADIVARLGSVMWVVECKTTLGFAVLNQAMRWERHAHMVSVAVPARSCPGSRFEAASRCFGVFGIGLIRAGWGVDQVVRPRLSRRIVGSLSKSLCDQTRSCETPGEQYGEYDTPFRRTCKSLVQHVNVSPGVLTKDLVKSIDHHYHSDLTAKSALVQWLRAGVIRGVRAEGKPLRWYPA